ncbi:hypothetical protein FH5_02111 [Priestia endophytica]|nr:hypothetical protein FH5_02111 [Priestia endophytica]
MLGSDIIVGTKQTALAFQRWYSQRYCNRYFKDLFKVSN